MKKMKFLAIAALAALVMSCGSKPYDSSKVSELSDKVFSLTAEDYPEVIKQADGILTYFEQNYSAEELKEKGHGILPENAFGSDTELFKTLNKFDNALYGMEDQMDDATKEAYANFQKHRDKVLGN
ncbi:MAG: hypothetical protein J6129_05195 [Bacteroidaceae bacterium]|nr:hypothetical protein [Bacteroidaceae bacterium]